MEADWNTLEESDKEGITKDPNIYTTRGQQNKEKTTKTNYTSI